MLQVAVEKGEIARNEGENSRGKTDMVAVALSGCIRAARIRGAAEGGGSGGAGRKRLKVGEEVQRSCDGAGDIDCRERNGSE